jgi:GT2 family glycosyltransferase
MAVVATGRNRLRNRGKSPSLVTPIPHGQTPGKSRNAGQPKPCRKRPFASPCGLDRGLIIAGDPAGDVQSVHSIPEVDVVASFVLYETPGEECDRAVGLMLGSSLPAHVIVVDNSRLPVRLACANDPRVTIIRPGSNVGYGRGHNLAIEMSRGRSPFHLVANTDIGFDTDVVAQLVGTMNDQPAVGLAAPHVLYPDGRSQPTARLLPRPIDLLAKRLPGGMGWTRRFRERFLLERWDRKTQAELPFITGCFMLFRRELLDSIGGFDPRFFVFGEDTDISRRAHRVARTLFVPDVFVTHDFRTEAKPSLRRTLLMIGGYIRYFNKWGWISDPEREAMNLRAIENLGLDRPGMPPPKA